MVPARSCATRPATRSTTPTSSASAGGARAALRPAVDAVSGLLPAEAVLEELRPAPRLVVRAEPSRRGFRRDVRRLAHARQRLAPALRRLAGAAEARVHGRADARTRGQAAAGLDAPDASSRSSACGRRCASTTRASASTTGSSTRTSTTATCGACSPTRRSTGRTSKASRFIQSIRGATCAGMVAEWTGSYQYTIDRVIEDMITRAANCTCA